MEPTLNTPCRYWRFRNIKKTFDDASDVKIMTYNILAEAYTRDAGYEYCDEDMLAPTSRHSKIVQDIDRVSPDIVCLQEVDRCQYEDRLKSDLNSRGYNSVRMTYRHKQDTDGLAVFYRTAELRLLGVKKCPSQDSIARQLKGMQLSEEKLRHIMTLAEPCQGALIVTFEHLRTGKSLTVCNAHIKWFEFKLPALSCMETASVLYEVLEEARGQAFIITGDFNSTPDFATYRFLRQGRIALTPDAWNKPPLFDMYKWNDGPWTDPALVKPHPSTDVLRHTVGSSRISSDQTELDKWLADSVLPCLQPGIPLSSAYLDITGEEPQVTNCEGGGWPGNIHQLCLDYIWFTGQHLTVESVLDTPTVEEIRRNHGLPNATMPSDHIHLAATLSFR